MQRSTLHDERMNTMSTAMNNEFQSSVVNHLGGMRALVVMLGVNSFVGDDGEIGFRFKGSRKANHLRVDLGAEPGRFDMHFYKCGAARATLVESFENVAGPVLPRVFERVTGLALSVPVVVGL